MQHQQLLVDELYETSLGCTTGETKLKTKVVKLTLQLDDCMKKIPMLKSVVQDNDWNQNNQYNEKEYEFALQFETQAKINSSNLLSLVEEYDRMIQIKTRLALESQELLERTKKAELQLSTELTAVHSNFLSHCNEVRCKWNEGKKDRELMAIKLKTREIHELTVRGLEPQLQKIIQAHQADQEKVESEAEALKERIRLEARRVYDDKMAKARHEWENRKQEAIFEKNKQWRHRIEALIQQQDQEIFETRKTLKQDLDVQRKWQQQELRALRETQRDEMTTRRISFTRCLQEERKKWIEENIFVAKQTKMDIEKFEKVEFEKNALWESRLAQQLETELAKEVEEIREAFEKQRDKDIDVIIRKLKRKSIEGNKCDATVCCKDSPCRIKLKLKTSMDNARSELEKAQEKLSAVNKNLETYTELKIQRQWTLEKQIKEIESVRVEFSSLIEQEKEIQIRIQHLEKEIMYESKLKMDGIESLKVQANQELGQVLRMMGEIERSHQKTLGLTHNKHEKKLLQLEHQVKKDISIIEQRCFAVQEEIDKFSAAYQQTLHLIQGYQATQQKSLDQSE